jgi:homocysteine S-methyltransferase
VVDRPQLIVTEAHRRFVEAGADVVITASYQASEPGFVAAGLTSPRRSEALALTTEVARRSRTRRWSPASVGPYGAYLGDGSEYHGTYAASWAEVRAFHRQRLEVLVDTGPDLFAIETIPSVAEAEIVARRAALAHRRTRLADVHVRRCRRTRAPATCSPTPWPRWRRRWMRSA